MWKERSFIKIKVKIPALASSLVGGLSACRVADVESNTFTLTELSLGNSDS